MNSYKSEFMYEFRIFTYIFMCMNSLLIYSWIHMIISYMNSYRLWIHMIMSYMNSYVYEFIYMNSYMKSCNLWIHMIFSYMNSYVSWIHIWIRVYQGSRCCLQRPMIGGRSLAAVPRADRQWKERRQRPRYLEVPLLLLQLGKLVAEAHDWRRGRSSDSWREHCMPTWMSVHCSLSR